MFQTLQQLVKMVLYLGGKGQRAVQWFRSFILIVDIPTSRLNCVGAMLETIWIVNFPLLYMNMY